jgi:SPOR domain
MRPVVILLLLANLTFFGYTRLDVTSDGEAARLDEQVQPEKIKLLTPPQVAALGPAKVAALSDVCLEWGPLGEAERARALADLEPLALGKLLSQRRIESSMAFWVYLPPAANRAEADRRAADLRALGVGDALVVDAGPQRNAVALGSFHTEDIAQARLADLVKLGVTNARLAPRQQVITQSVLVIRDPQAPVVAKLRDLVAAYPGTDAKVGSCEKS